MSNKILRDTFDTTNEISKRLKFSPRLDILFEKIKSEISPELPGFRTLCPTRWTVKADSLCSVINDYSVFQEFWEKARDIISDSETRARIAGVEAYMSKFEYIFDLVLGECVLRHTDNLSKTLQSPKLNASEGQRIAELTCLTVERIRTNECFDEFWEKVLQLARKHGINEPTLPRKSKVPARYEVGSEDGHFHDFPKMLFQHNYFEVLDFVVNFVRQQFNQPDYAVYKHLVDLLLKAARCKAYNTEYDFIVQFYGEDLNKLNLKIQP